MEIAADNIDKLINIEMRRTGMPRGKKWVLWEVAREVSSGPLVLQAICPWERTTAQRTAARPLQHGPAAEDR
jgi:hypothetical protein